MKDYMDTMFADAPLEMQGHATTPAAKHLFEVNTRNPVYLEEERAKTYHYITAQALYLSHWLRHDIRTAVVFLCTRVQKPDEDD